MLRLILYVITLIALLSACSTSRPVSANYGKMTIAFGSCNHQSEAQPMWKQITKNKPDLWIWLGDIIYADTEDMSKMKMDYDQQKANPDYAAFAATTPIIGIWDDHDYGSNDAGKEYAKKDSSKLLLFDFLGEDDSLALNRLGAYTKHTFKNGPLDIKVLLLDTRSFRDSLGFTRGSILGGSQWNWLIRELTNSPADVHIIGGGIQFVSEEHQYEKWANFPSERERLMQIIDILNVKNPILISGDRHIGEISLDKTPAGNPILDITSSGLTHAYDDFTTEPNEHRIGPVTKTTNFGLLTIEKTNGRVIFEGQIKDVKNKTTNVIYNDELKRLLSPRNKKVEE